METKLNEAVKDFLNEANINDVIQVIDQGAITIQEIKEYNKIIDNKELTKKEKKKTKEKYEMKCFFRKLINN